MLDLFAEAKDSGKQLRDANTVSTMLEHGARQLDPDHPADFKRFRTIDVLELQALAPAAS